MDGVMDEIRIRPMKQVTFNSKIKNKYLVEVRLEKPDFFATSFSPTIEKAITKAMEILIEAKK